MSELVTSGDPRFAGLSSKAYEHPADRAATAALASIPMLDQAVRKLVELRYERAYRQLYLADSVKVAPDQLPATWAAYERAHRALDMPAPYDLYVHRGAVGSAQTIGADRPIIVLDSMLAGLLDADEQRAVIAHELGHVLSDHVLYRTALGILLEATQRALPFPFALPARALTAVLLEWARTTELSSDRAAALAVGDPLIVCRALMVVAAGLPSAQLSLDAFLAQAMTYERWDDTQDRVRRFFAEAGATHAFAVRRVSEVTHWVQSGAYDRIRDGDYPRRGEPADARAAAGAAVDFYVERFRALFEDTGESVERFGRQVTDWLRRGGESGVMTKPLILICVLALVAAGCGDKTKTITVTGANGKKTTQTVPDVHFAKTKFVLHAGLAFGAFHRYVLKPYRAGAFAKNAPHRKKAFVKAAAASLFAVHELKQARRAALSDDRLRPLANRLDGLTSQLGGLGAGLKGGSLNPGTLLGAGGAIAALTSLSGKAGATVKDRSAPGLGG